MRVGWSLCWLVRWLCSWPGCFFWVFVEVWCGCWYGCAHYLVVCCYILYVHYVLALLFISLCRDAFACGSAILTVVLGAPFLIIEERPYHRLYLTSLDFIKFQMYSNNTCEVTVPDVTKLMQQGGVVGSGRPNIHHKTNYTQFLICGFSIPLCVRIME